MVFSTIIKHYVMPLIPHANGRQALVSQLLIQLHVQIKHQFNVFIHNHLDNVQQILILPQHRHNLA